MSGMKGKLGKVFFGVMNGMNVAVRQITLARVNTYVIEKLETEIADLRNITNPYLLPTLKVIIKKPNLDLVMPFVQKGSLFSALHQEKTRLSLGEKLEICKQIALSMKLTHQQGRVHGHLSSHNVFLDTDSVLVGDLGLEHLKKYVGLMGGYCNKSAWSSPEVLKEAGDVVIKPTVYDDVYSFGIILWEIMTEQEPFPDYSLKKLKELVGEQGYRPALREFEVKGMQELIKSCWNIQPSSRPSFQLMFSTLNKIREAYN
jgi:serine/threonine protein kinase